MSNEFFEKLSSEDLNRLKKMVLEKPLQTVNEFRKLTGCSLDNGLMWLDNMREEIWYESLPPCPYCGEKLRTPWAKQCRHCLRDWHDENELKWLS